MPSPPYKYIVIFSFLFIVPLAFLILFNRYFADYHGRTALVCLAEIVGASGLVVVTGNSRLPGALKATIIIILSVAIFLFLLGIYLVFNFNPQIG